MASHTSSPSQFGYRSSTSRRSFPNLQHASLAPLSSRFPMDDEHIDHGHEPQILTPSTLMDRSAPPTPGILSNGDSSDRKAKKKKEKKQQFTARFSHESYFPSDAPGGLSIKAKSSSALLGMPDHNSTLLSARGRHNKSKSAQQLPDEDEWIHRAGLAITSENRITKGQSWLASRASSTNLVLTSTGDEYHSHQSTTKITTLSSGEHVADQSGSEPPTPRFAGTPGIQSRQGSRAASRQGSRAPSRRGSRAGSRLELTGMTPLDSSKFSAALSRHAESRDGYFDGADDAAVEPDFVDAESEGESYGREEDSEVARLARQRGFGLGGVVDRLVGWTLFNVDEDADSGDAKAGDAGTDDEGSAEAAAQKKQRRRDLLERTASHSAVSTRMGTERDPPPPPAPSGQQGEGSWQDAAWLLSVASKVLY